MTRYRFQNNHRSFHKLISKDHCNVSTKSEKNEVCSILLSNYRMSFKSFLNKVLCSNNMWISFVSFKAKLHTLILLLLSRTILFTSAILWITAHVTFQLTQHSWLISTKLLIEIYLHNKLTSITGRIWVFLSSLGLLKWTCLLMKSCRSKLILIRKTRCKCTLIWEVLHIGITVGSQINWKLSLCQLRLPSLPF